MGIFGKEKPREAPLTKEEKIAEHLGASLDLSKLEQIELAPEMLENAHMALENARGKERLTLGINSPIDKKGNVAFKNSDIFMGVAEKAGIDLSTADLYEGDTVINETHALEEGGLYTKEIAGNPKSIAVKDGKGAVIEYSPEVGVYIAPEGILGKHDFKKIEE